MPTVSDPSRCAPSPPGVPGDGLELRYPARSIVADLARGAGGLALSLAPLALAAPPWPVSLGLLGLAALFAAFLLQTWRRGRSVVRLDEGGIVLLSAGGRRALAWRDLDRLRLRWFGPRRPGAGWLDLELGGGGERLVLTSGLAGFGQVLARAVEAAERNGVGLEPASRANLAELRAARGPAGSSGLRG